jgi:hypothetical protein
VNFEPHNDIINISYFFSSSLPELAGMVFSLRHDYNNMYQIIRNISESMGTIANRLDIQSNNFKKAKLNGVNIAFLTFVPSIGAT